MKRILPSAPLLIVLTLSWQASRAAEGRHALIIGIGEYSQASQTTALPGVPKDMENARKMARATGIDDKAVVGALILIRLVILKYGCSHLLLKDDTLKRHFAALPPIHQAAVNWQLEWSQQAHDHQIEVEVHLNVFGELLKNLKMQRQSER